MIIKADNNPAGSETDYLRNDPSLLLASLHKSINRRIEELISAADSEIQTLDEELKNYLEQIRSLEQQKYAEKTEFEKSRMQNLLSIEKKKIKLEVMELFINKVMDETALSLREDPRYIGFLKECVVKDLSEVRGKSVTVLISEPDLSFSEEIMKEIIRRKYNLKVEILSDERVKSGGAMVVDDETEVVYNNTVERIIYRKNEEIRREILRGLKDLAAYQGD